MPTLNINPPFPIFTERNGQPLENGYIYVGTASLDPQTNPISVYWDKSLSQPAAQPIRTLGGYPVNNGSPARIYADSDYSIRVFDRKGTSVYSSSSTTDKISSVVFAGSSITTSDIADGAVTNPKLASNAVTTVKITDGSVTPTKLSTNGPYWDSSGRVGIGTSSPVNESRLTVAGNSLSVTGPDGNFNAGGNRAIMDFTSGAARFGSANGGGSATSVAFISNGFVGASIDSSGNFGINSGFGSVGTIYGCRAWVNFNGTGTVAIRSSGNVSSITDSGVGDYYVNFTNAMPDANYAAIVTSKQHDGTTATTQFGSFPSVPVSNVFSTSSVRVCARGGASDVLSDAVVMCVAIFR
jgi:hypothetical protein